MSKCVCVCEEGCAGVTGWLEVELSQQERVDSLFQQVSAPPPGEKKKKKPHIVNRTN